MPIFELVCENCGEKLDIICNHDEIKKLKCKKCKKKGKMKQVPAKFGFSIKGPCGGNNWQ